LSLKPILFSLCVLLGACATQQPQGSITEEQRNTAQLEALLRHWEYLDARVNGKLGEADRTALAQFRSDWAIPDTAGRDVVITYLRREHEKTSAKDAFPIEGMTCTIENPYPQPRETAHWTGDCVNGKLQGYGTLSWKFLRRGEWTEATTEGTMTDGIMNGPVISVHPNSYVYEGNYVDFLRQGQGKMVRDNGWTYVGNWNDNVADGQGTVTSPSGETFSGIFKRGCLPGPAGGFITFGPSERQCEERAAQADG